MKLPVLRRGKTASSTERYAKALEFIDGYWRVLVRSVHEDTGTLIGLPHNYLVPSADLNAVFQFEEQYYWDSYFMVLGLSEPKHQPVVEGMLENLLHLLRRFGTIPNASRMYFTSRSQPPILTTFIFHVYDSYHKDNEWLRERITLAKTEYEQVWMSTTHPAWHNVYRGLSRYYDINALHDLAEAESGWDMTPRFERKCLDFLPVDLNALLFKYETDFARAAQILGEAGEEKKWHEAAEQRRRIMDELMWGKLRSFYFDYNYQRNVLGDIWSLAGFFPMWAGMVDERRAAKMAGQLKRFEKKGGLTTTSRPLIDYGMFGSVRTQWAYPNGWAPLHYIVIEGLKRYGYHDDARRIALKWLETNLEWFEQNGEFLEKYNVVNRKKKPVEGVYPTQIGFGWTNSIFVKLYSEYAANS